MPFQSFDFECTWRSVFQKRVDCTKFNINVSIKGLPKLNFDVPSTNTTTNYPGHVWPKRSFLCLYVLSQVTQINGLESEWERSCISSRLAATYFLPQVLQDHKLCPVPWWTLLWPWQPENEENDFPHGSHVYLWTSLQCCNNCLWL
jgi:hypothetical protein